MGCCFGLVFLVWLSFGFFCCLFLMINWGLQSKYLEGARLEICIFYNIQYS